MTTYTIVDDTETAFWQVVNEDTGEVVAEVLGFFEAQRIRNEMEEAQL